MTPLVVVSGALANKPNNGGEAWVRLSWALGLRRLGCRVLFVEQISPDHLTDSSLAYFRGVVERFGLAGAAALVESGTRRTEGLAWGELLDAPKSADLLLNISGHLRHDELFPRFRRTAYIDIDPGFTQFWHADGTLPVRPHDFYYTIGANIGFADCAIPTGGISWRHVRQPVVLDHWPVVSTPAKAPLRFTTVASWRGPFGAVRFGDRTFGLKVHEFRKFIEVPRRGPPGCAFEVALDIHPADAKDFAMLKENGWRVVNPTTVAATPEKFRDYVRASAAEFSVAQGIYVDTNCGWFSDRTTRYLASGRPALVQDTGISRSIDCGEGLVPFRTLDEAVEGARRIARDYDTQSRAARSVVERYFDSDTVLRGLLDNVGLKV